MIALRQTAVQASCRGLFASATMHKTARTPANPVRCLHSPLPAGRCQRSRAVRSRQPFRSTAPRSSKSADQYNLLLDCDGVLVDTEAQGHRVSFNNAFRQKGLDFSWSEEEYGHLLAIGGGKERMTHYFTEHNYIEPFRSMTSLEDRQAYVKDMHLLKTDLFMKLIEEGQLPLRPGVRRLIDEAMDAGAQVAICSTSNEKAVQKIVDVMLPEAAAKIRVFAGDIVPRKKPDPAIYMLAAKELGVQPSRCVVVEDSHIGLKAAKAAGMRCVVTKSSYTETEDFTKADAVFDCIGDKGDERFTFADMIGDKLTQH